MRAAKFLQNTLYNHFMSAKTIFRWPRAFVWICALAGLGHFNVLTAQTNTSQRATISGYVTDIASGEALIGATVQDVNSRKGTSTNTYGFFSLTLPAGDSVTLLVTYLGYKPQGYRLLLTNDVQQNVALSEQNVLQEVVIKAERYERIEERAQMSRIDVPIEQIKNVPALLGEKDVLKALQLLPGVSGGGEGQSGIYVRGGGPDQNLILLDGVPVYNASHLFGFFSVFNTDAIKDVSLIKGGFPARYGGRLSSVIEINMKEGNDQEFHGEGSIGIIASKLTLEGPIIKGKSSFIVSARRTYIDILARPLIVSALRAEGSDGVFGYFFDDVNAKVNYRLSDKDRLYLSYYGGRDKFYSRIDDSDEYNADGNRYEYETSNSANFGWGNRTAALRWNHVFTPKLFSNTTLTFSRYRFNTGVEVEDINRLNSQTQSVQNFDLNYVSGINDWAGRIDFDYLPNPSHYVRFGASAIAHSFRPGRFTSRIYNAEVGLDTSETKTNFIEPNIAATELGVYVEDDWKVTDRLRINAGLHFAGFVLNDDNYWSLQPRFNARYLFDKGWSAKASFSTMRQFIHLLTNETIGLPTDLWLPATDKVKPQDAWQVAVGGAKTFGKDYEVSIEAFYKEMNNVIAFREGASAFQFQNWEERVAQGLGTAYGAEFFVQKKRGRFSGWMGYTLSWAWRQIDDINFGKRYPYKYDRRHDFEVTGSYKLTKRVSLAGTWVFSTGNALTFQNARYIGPDPGGFGGNGNPFLNFIYENTHTPERNNFRFPATHRLDVGIEFHKQKKRYERTWAFGAYNAYSRRNPFYLYTDTEARLLPDGSIVSETVLKQQALFPIIPYINWSFKF
jgi:TonB-dependent Receptor Plug Domain/TonB dependent receptor/CarboxypepD_reg-like domain